MGYYVRPQIYATLPIREVEKQLRRGVIPAPFVRRMRVINIISAITLRKIEASSILPFDILDLHHVLDRQISQDAIISMLDNPAVAVALYDGDLRLLWENARTMPLLKRGFDQGWIQRFMLAPFDPICMMLAMRAKLLLDAIDELGHSYNLLRALGWGWIDFGEIPGEEAGDPGSYVPPGIDQPIDSPPGYPEPGPGDPGYTSEPGSPGYTPPNGGIGGASGIPDSPLPPITLETGPGSPLSGGGAGTSRPAWGFNCCLSVEDPESYVEIGYLTDHIDPAETLGLTVENAHESCAGSKYAWAITSGGGELSEETGLEVIYTAPASGHGCPGNTEISLYCGGEEVDTLDITIDYEYSIEYDYEESDAEIIREDSALIYVIANNTPLSWSVEGTGFSLEHEETDGVGNVLHADETACGSAKITVVGCNSASTIGYARCTTGQWSGYTNGCILSGTPDSSVWGVTTLQLTKTQGKYEQVQTVVGCYGLSAECCDDVNCLESCGAGDCVNCTDCLTFSCTEMFGGAIDCGDWCCSTEADCGPEDHTGYCIGNKYLRWREWVC